MASVARELVTGVWWQSFQRAPGQWYRRRSCLCLKAFKSLDTQLNENICSLLAILHRVLKTGEFLALQPFLYFVSSRLWTFSAYKYIL